MKRFLFSALFLFAIICSNNLFAQAVNASPDPKLVAEKFLDLYFKGEWFQAAETCGTADCTTQIEVMMRKMAMDDVTDESGKCKFTIDSIKVEPDQKSGKVFFTKICNGNKKPVINHIVVLKDEDKWYVEYIFKRDRYL